MSRRYWLTAELSQLADSAAAVRRRGIWRRHNLLAEGFRSRHATLSGRLPLLHLCANTEPIGGAVPFPRAGHGYRYAGENCRLQRGPVYFG